MSVLDGAKKLAQSFLTLDDLVLAQSLGRGGLGQLSRVGVSTSGPSVALNVGARFACLGAQVATRAAAAPVGMADFIPMADDVKAFADSIGDQAKALGERCSTLAIHGIELSAGTKPQNPITRQDWLEKQASPGYTPGELTADSTLGTLQSVTAMSLAMGMNAMQMTTDGVGSDTLRKAVDSSLDRMPGTSGQGDRKSRRQGLVAVALESGMPLAQTLAAWADATARLAFSDTRALHEELTRGLARARLLAREDPPEGTEKMEVGARLRESAKKVADNPPEKLIAALEKGSDGKAPSPSAILNAMIADSGPLAIFVTVYPRILGLLGSDLMALAGGTTGMGGTKSAQKKSDDGTSVTFTVLDSLVGGAVTKDDETPLFPRATVFLAQDLSFEEHRDRKGRETALERAERIYGADVRERIAADVSLNRDIMDTEGRARTTKLRDYISEISDEDDLSRQLDLCAERLALLESSEAGAMLVTVANPLTDRIEALRLFTALAGSDLGLRGVKTAGVSSKARNAFLTWASKQD